MTQDLGGVIGLEGVIGLGGRRGEVEVAGGARARFDDGQVGGVAFDRKERATGSEANGGFGICGIIIEQLRQFAMVAAIPVDCSVANSLIAAVRRAELMARA
jgi:hypothetical protein